MFANVIFPAFVAAYASWVLLAPLAVGLLALEGWILWHFNPQTSLKAIASCAVGMNVVSYIVGLVLAPFLFVESGLTVYEGVVDRGPQWQQLAQESFVQAWLVSVAVEATMLWAIRRIVNLDQIVKPVILGNSISYAVLSSAFIYVR